MAYLGFTKELQRQSTLAGLTNKIRSRRAYNEALLQRDEANVRESALQAIGEAKQQFADNIGLPAAGSSPEEKARYANYIADYAKSTIQKSLNFNTAHSEASQAAKHKTAVAVSLWNKGRFETKELANAMDAGWGDERLPNPLDVFKQTADARATALGITRFRGTDGAMSTLGSIGSLFYKDNVHMSGKGRAAFLGAATAASCGLLQATSTICDSMSD